MLEIRLFNNNFFVYFQNFTNIFNAALKEHGKRNRFLKTADLRVGKVYRFKRIRACLDGKFGAMVTIFLRDGQYTLPSKLGKLVLTQYQKKGMMKQYQKLISEDGLLGDEAVYLKLQSVGGANNNSPNFITMSSKEGEKALQLQGDNLSEEEEEEEEVAESTQPMMIINSDDDEVFC